MHKLLKTLLFLLPLALPLYVIRFNLGPLPTTVLEIYILAFLATWFINADPLSFSPYPWGTSKLKSLLDRREAKRGLSSWTYPIFAWLLATLIAVFIAPDKLAAFGHWRAFMLEPALIFIALLDLYKSDKAKKYIDATLLGIAVVTILMGLYAILQFATGLGIPSPWDIWPGRRATGTFGFPNGLSLFMAPLGIMSLIALITNAKCQMPNNGVPSGTLIYDKSRRLPIFGIRNSSFGIQCLAFISSFLLSGASILLAKSIGGILAFGLGFLLVLLFNKKTRLYGWILLAVSIIGALGWTATLLNTKLDATNIENSIVTQKKWSSLTRIVIWQEAIEVIKDHPIFGTGLRSYPTAVIPYHTATWMEIFPHPHNLFLMLWIETGLPGLLVFLWLCFTWLWLNSKYQIANSKSDLTLNHEIRSPNSKFYIPNSIFFLHIIPLLVILVQGLVDMPYFKNDLALIFWLLAALCTSPNFLPVAGDDVKSPLDRGETKRGLVLPLLALLTFAAGCLNPSSIFNLQTSNSTSTAGTAEDKLPDGVDAIVYQSAGCGHCEEVESFIKNNHIDSKINIQTVEAFQDKQTYNDFVAHSKACGMDITQIGTPMLWDGKNCYRGADKIYDYLSSLK